MCLAMTYDPDQRAIVGVARNGYVSSMSLADGKMTNLFIPGVDAAPYLSGLAYDPSTDRFVWNVVNTAGESSLYQFSREGQVEKLVDLPSGQEFSYFLCTDDWDINPKAPARSTIDEINFRPGAYSGTITYIMPSKLQDGTEFSGTVLWRAYVDGNEVSRGTCSAGTTLEGSYAITLKQMAIFANLTGGMHRFSFTTEFNGHESAPVTVVKWIGLDNPKPVSNILLEDNGYYARFYWDTYECEGEHGGYVDENNVMFDVYMNDKLINTFPELITNSRYGKINNTWDYPDTADTLGNFNPYTLKVVVSSGPLKSQPAYSNRFCVGDPWKKTPVEILPTSEEANLFTYWYETNEAEDILPSQWSYDQTNGIFVCDQSSPAARKSWLVMPRLCYPTRDNSGEDVYEVSFHVGSAYVTNPNNGQRVYLDNGRLGVYACNAVDPTTRKSKPLLENITFDGSKDNVVKCYLTKDMCNVNTHRGYASFYINFKAESSLGESFVPFIHSISVKRADVDYKGPKAVTDLTATAAPAGECKALVKFTLPVQRVDGKKLDTAPTTNYSGPVPGYKDSLMNVRVIGAEIVELKGKPGQVIETEVKTVQGMNTITVQTDMTFWETVKGSDGTTVGSYNNYRGIPAETTVYTGVGLPGRVSGLNAVVGQNDLDLSLAWKMPEEYNADGQYVDVANLEYSVWKYVSATDENPAHYELVENADVDNKAGTATISTPRELDVYSYIVLATNKAGTAGDSPVVSVQAGKPYSCDIDETFADQQPHYLPLGLFKPSQEYEYAVIRAGDPASLYPGFGNENSFAAIAYVSLPGTKCRVFLPKFSTVGMKDATFSLRYLTGHVPDGNQLSENYVDPDEITVLANAYGLESPMPLRVITPPAPALVSWKTVKVEIPAELLGKEWIELYIDGFFSTTNQFLVFDRYSVGGTSGVAFTGDALHSVRVLHGAIVAEGFAGQEISVYCADGSVIASRKAGDVETFRTAPGVYVVRSGDFTRKVIVK